jgi:ADP-L-glycero-D-manno-heptose 6-epimerase
MIVVTGGAGFIGSAIINRLNELGENNIIVVDELGSDEKWKNLVPLRYKDFINKHEFPDRLESHIYKINAIIHMGANSSTTEKDADHLLKNNYEYTKRACALYSS